MRTSAPATLLQQAMRAQNILLVSSLLLLLLLPVMVQIIMSA
jgi:hypothetical protein